MTITSSGFSVRLLRAAAIISLLSGIGGMPGRGVLAEDRKVDVDPAEDPAEVQRRQQIKQQATHWEQQFTKILYGDLELLRALCGDLPRESRRAIAKTGEQAVKDAALQMAELQMGGRQRRLAQGIVIQGGAVVVNGKAVINMNPLAQPGRPAKPKPDVEKSPDNPVTILSATLTKSVAEHVGSEQAKAFAEQIARRDDRRKAAMIREIVAVLDGELVLTASQREEIERSLREKWNDSMAMTLQGIHMNNGRRVFPGVPGACVSPHLTKAQRQRFVPEPDANRQQRGGWQHQAWMQTVNMLNNVNPAGRDPWWFE
jgi:hypothetical protein